VWTLNSLGLTKIETFAKCTARGLIDKWIYTQQIIRIHRAKTVSCCFSFITSMVGWNLKSPSEILPAPKGMYYYSCFLFFSKRKIERFQYRLSISDQDQRNQAQLHIGSLLSSLYRYIDGKYSMKDEDQKSISCLTLFWSVKDCNWVNYHLGCHDNHNPRQARIMVIICLSWFNCTLFARGTVDANLVGKVNISGRYLPCQVLCLSYRFWAYAWRFLRILGKPWSFGSWRSPFRRKVKSFTKHTNLDKSIPPNLTKY
jgi:hypothetical protein